MADLKTAPNEASVGDFIDSIEDNQRRADCKELMKLMREITGKRARMWGSSIVGFGTYHYKYARSHCNCFFFDRSTGDYET